MQERYAFTEDAAMMLRQAGDLLDRIAEAEAAVKADGFMLPTRGGGSRVHPAVRIAQDARSLLLRYLQALGIEEA